MAQVEQVASSVEYYPSADCWVEEAGKVFLIGSRCPKCGKQTFPRRTVCDGCGTSGEQESVRLPSAGTLYSYSEIHVAPKFFATPYVIGYVDLPGDVRVFGQVEHAAAELRPDEPVEVVLGVIRKLDSGQPVVSYKFRKTGGTRNA